MKKTALRISAWGFTAAELANWPPDLIPVPVTQGPFDGALLVHARAAESFVTEAEAYPLADGRLAPAVLYAAGDVPLAPGVPVDFAAVVDCLDVDQLTELLDCPQRFLMLEYVEELSSGFLRGLTKPIAEVAAKDLPLPAAVTAHLQTCSACRAAFDEAVAARRRWQRLVFCPPPAQLHALLSGVKLPAVAQHLAECPQCAAEAAALRRTMQPAWITVSLRAGSSLVSAAAQNFAVQKALLVTVMHGLLQQMQPAGAQLWRRPAADTGESDVAGWVHGLLGGEDIKLVREHRDLTVQMTPDHTAIVISALHGEGQAALLDFHVELWGEEDLQWSGRSQGGRLLLPLEALATALKQGTVNLVVRPGSEQGTPTE